MVQQQYRKSTKRKYPKFWDKFIPLALILITAIIIFLVYVTVRVALGMAAF